MSAITSKTTAIMVTHLCGIPADLDALYALADKHGLALLEDASHAHGATIGGQKIGTFCQAAAFSMNGPKPLSAGEGGFVLTNHRPRQTLGWLKPIEVLDKFLVEASGAPPT